MITPQYCQVMATYAAHLNDKLLACCGQLSDAELKRDHGAFFGSIFRTLEHVVFGDRAWMTRFTGTDYRQGLKIGDPIARQLQNARLFEMFF